MIIVSGRIYVRPGARQGRARSRLEVRILRANVFRHVIASTSPA